MNKEVIYLEPEDDITDILTKLQQAEQKLVALVPPKKATMLRSPINMKLVARTAKECDKVAVIVTADPAIVKMAMMAQIPIAKTLQSRPVVPTKEDLADSMAEEQIIDEDLADASAAAELEEHNKNHAKTPGSAPKNASAATSPQGAEVIDLNEESLDNGSQDGKKPKNKDQKDKSAPKVPSFEKYRKWIIIGCFVLALVIGFSVWAFVVAPAAKITIAMNTSSDNVSEEVSFTQEQNAQNFAENILYVEKQTYEQRYETEFTASGSEDRGDRASGKVTASFTFTPSSQVKNGVHITIPAGAELVAKKNGKIYHTTTSASIEWDGNDTDRLKTLCASKSSNLKTSCTASVTIPVEAISSGEEFNLDSGSEWNDYDSAVITNPEAISGGTTKNITTVSLADVHDARDRLVDEHAEEGKSKLLSQLKGEDLVMIEPSYAEETIETTSKPEVGTEVKDDTKTTVSIKVSYSVYTLKKSQLEQYFEEKLEIGDDQRIYSIGDPVFDRFTSIEEPARLKTTVKTGPTVTEEDIIERTKGKKIGEVQSLLKSINGVDSVNVSPSYFWVRSIPNDPNRVTVDLTVEDKK